MLYAIGKAKKEKPKKSIRSSLKLSKIGYLKTYIGASKVFEAFVCQD